MKDDNLNQNNINESNKEKQEEQADQDQQEQEIVVEERVRKTEKKEKNKEEALSKKIEELEDQLKRTIADYRNLQKRSEEERREFIKFANREILLELLPAFDALFLAEKYIEDEGLKLSVKMLKDTFERMGIKRIETEGKLYNAELMECIAIEDGEENKVLSEVRPGFLMHGRIFRPAQVKVGRKS